MVSIVHGSEFVPLSGKFFDGDDSVCCGLVVVARLRRRHGSDLNMSIMPSTCVCAWWAKQVPRNQPQCNLQAMVHLMPSGFAVATQEWCDFSDALDGIDAHLQLVFRVSFLKWDDVEGCRCGQCAASVTMW